jgi:hypothetical protein
MIVGCYFICSQATHSTKSWNLIILNKAKTIEFIFLKHFLLNIIIYVILSNTIGWLFRGVVKIFDSGD